ncbi:sulfotransferase family protein [Halioxenophilus aromaticivorans]|uniref:Sulfotransferase family 2 domain-containing protein n=1 Tax=Halioxenophilus aromaticivorans TaxID=1306992 RepID=A0AAV3U121_9ALTE
MISKKHQCLFVHIPKAAGQSIERVFLNENNLTWEDRAPLLLRKNIDRNKGPERLAHLTAEEYLKYGYISEQDFGSYFKFTFVRNPWSRLVSEYNYRGYNARFSFETFLTKKLPKKDSYNDRYRHILPQSDFIYCSETGKNLVDFIGKFENLQSDFDTVCKKLGIINSDLPHTNKPKKANPVKSFLNMFLGGKKETQKKHYTEYYSEATISIVEEMYSQDIETFNYRFER